MVKAVTLPLLHRQLSLRMVKAVTSPLLTKPTNGESCYIAPVSQAAKPTNGESCYIAPANCQITPTNLVHYQLFMVGRIDLKIVTYWHLPFCETIKTENQLRFFRERVFPWQPGQRLVHSNWMDGFLILEEIMQFSISRAEFGHFTSVGGR